MCWPKALLGRADRDRVLWSTSPPARLHAGRLAATRVIPEAMLAFPETVGAVVSLRAASSRRRSPPGSTRSRRLVRQPPVPRSSTLTRPAASTTDAAIRPAASWWAVLALDDRVQDEILVRVEPDGSIFVIDDDLGLSNGLAFSPDGHFALQRRHPVRDGVGFAITTRRQAGLASAAHSSRWTASRMVCAWTRRAASGSRCGDRARCAATPWPGTSSPPSMSLRRTPQASRSYGRPSTRSSSRPHRSSFRMRNWRGIRSPDGCSPPTWACAGSRPVLGGNAGLGEHSAPMKGFRGHRAGRRRRPGRSRSRRGLRPGRRRHPPGWGLRHRCRVLDRRDGISAPGHAA